MNLKHAIDLRVYPKGASFAVLLTWHLKRGTRPDGTTEGVGLEILQADFASQINEEPRNIANWCNGPTRPRNTTRIEKGLFGTSLLFDEWRADLRLACSRTKPVSNGLEASNLVPSLFVAQHTHKNPSLTAGTKLPNVSNLATPALLVQPHPFSPLEVLFKLKRPFIAEIATECLLHITELRGALISKVIDLVHEQPDIENFKHLKRVATFVRVFYPFWHSDMLWHEAAELVHRQYQGIYDGAFATLRAYKDLRTATDKVKIFELFADIAEERAKRGDAQGFCEARVKQAHLLIFEKRPAQASILLLDTEAKFYELAATPNEFTPLYERDPSGILSDVFIALTRSEVAQRNLRSARIYSGRASALALQAQDRHRLGNCAEDRAVISFLDNQQELASHQKNEAIRLFEEYGDQERAKATTQLLTNSMSHFNADF